MQGGTPGLPLQIHIPVRDPRHRKDDVEQVGAPVDGVAPCQVRRAQSEYSEDEDRDTKPRQKWHDEESGKQLSPGYLSEEKYDECKREHDAERESHSWMVSGIPSASILTAVPAWAAHEQSVWSRTRQAFRPEFATGAA